MSISKATCKNGAVRERHYRHGTWRTFAGHRVRVCCITTWATSTAMSAPGDLPAAAWGGVESIAGAFQACGGELRTEAGVDKIRVANGKAMALRSTTARRSTPHCCVGDGRQADLSELHGRTSRLADFTPRSKFQDSRLVRQAEHRAGRPADVPGACRKAVRCISATCTSSIRWSAWSEPTTTGKTAPGRKTRTSTWSYRRWTTRPWRPRASTS